MKRILLLMILALMTVSIWAYDVEIDGIYYNLDRINYTAEVTYSEEPFCEYSGNVTIPLTISYSGKTYKVESIGENAFSSCNSLTSVNIQSNYLKSIGERAFSACSNLTSITFGDLPNGIIIKTYAFYACPKLKTINIPSLYKWFGVSFAGAAANPLYNAGTLYVNGEALKDIVIPNGITVVQNYAFYGYTGLTSVKFCDTLQRIGAYAFSNCDGLTAIGISNSVNSIDEGAFYSCGNLFSIMLPNSVSIIGSSAFSYTALRSVTIPNTLIEIKDYTFQGCNLLESATIPSSVKRIGERAFDGCSRLFNVTCLAQNVPTSNSEIFSYFGTLHVLPGCSAAYASATYWKNFNIVEDNVPITSINIDASTSELNYGETLQLSANIYPDYASNKRVQWTSNNTNVATVSSNGLVTAIRTGKATITCMAMDGSGVNATLQISVNSSGKCGDNVYYSLNYVTGVLKIEGTGSMWDYNNDEDEPDYSPFRWNSNIKEVQMAEGVSYIGSYMFALCDNLTSITIPSSIWGIGYYPFRDCSNLQRVNISDLTAWCTIDFKTTESNPLYYAGHLYLNNVEVRNLIIPSSISNIQSDAFINCSSLTSVTIPNSVRTIGRSAFSGCNWLESVVIPSSVTYIYDYAFSNCKIKSIIIPSSVTSIYDNAFNGCYDLNDVTCLASIAPWIYSNTFSRYKTLHVLPGCGDAYRSRSYWKDFTIVEDAVDPYQRTITFGASDYATYCSDANLDFSEVEGIKAYIASSYNPGSGSLTITRVDNVPAGEGMLLKGTAGESYDVQTTDNASVVANLLKGNTTATTLYPTDGDYTNYVLSKNSEDVMGFYRFTGSVAMPANKAWLQIPTSALGGGGAQANVRGFRLVEEGEEMTAISEVKSESEENNIIYDLQGRRVNSALSRGVYIKNGKKIIMK